MAPFRACQLRSISLKSGKESRGEVRIPSLAHATRRPERPLQEALFYHTLPCLACGPALGPGFPTLPETPRTRYPQSGASQRPE